jgi:DNA-binding beta-propeller fold protein YncE
MIALTVRQCYQYDLLLYINRTTDLGLQDENVLREPRGIAFDKNKNLYVAGRSTNNVVVLSPDGSNCREILTQNDGLDRPLSLRINIDRNELLVCNLSGPAFVFSLV